MDRKSFGMTLAALAVGATLGVAGLQSISAATGGQSSLIENLAEKFNTSTENVRSVFEQTRQERQQERRAEIEDSLSQAVKDGKITEDQKNTILSKMENIRKQMDEVRSAQEDLHSWADDNNVDLSEFMPGRPMFGGPRVF